MDEIDYVYLSICGDSWEDIVVFLSKDEAKQESIRSPHVRIEIFEKKEKKLGYIPTYYYYKNGYIIHK